MESSSLTQAWVVTRSVPTTFRTHWDEWWVTPGLPRTSSGLILKIYRALARRNENTCKTRVSDALLFSMRRSSVTGVQTRPPPENHKTTKPTFNVGAHWSASEAPFKWRFAFLWYLDPLYPSTKKNAVRVGASVSRSVREVKGPMCRIFLLSTVCFYTIVHKDVHLLETSFQTSCVKAIARGQSSPLHTSCDVRFLPTMWYFDKCRLRWVCSTPTSVP